MMYLWSLSKRLFSIVTSFNYLFTVCIAYMYYTNSFLIYVLYTYTVSFQIYDYDGDGKISKAELTSLTTATLREYGLVSVVNLYGINNYTYILISMHIRVLQVISEAQINDVVATTMKTPGLATPGFITYQE